MVANASWQRLLWRVHHDEEGAVSLETVLIIGAIALPVLIFLLTVGWPMVKTFFTQGMQQLQEGSQAASASG